MQTPQTQSQLLLIAEELSQRVHHAKENSEFFEFPFKHLVLDNFLPDSLLRSCLKSFPALDSEVWEKAEIPGIEIKYRSMWRGEFDVPDGIISTVRILNSASMLRAMSERFKIPKLMSDPYFTGGGLNCTPTGGLLDVHIDGNFHDASGMHRRMNAILYFNPNWESSWGGEFGIYADDGTSLIKSLAPLNNRLVLFDSHDKSFHGLPNPINFPQHEPRKSLLLYYYTTAQRPSSTVTIDKPHSALWVSKNLTDKYGSKSRDIIE